MIKKVKPFFVGAAAATIASAGALILLGNFFHTLLDLGSVGVEVEAGAGAGTEAKAGARAVQVVTLYDPRVLTVFLILFVLVWLTLCLCLFFIMDSSNRNFQLAEETLAHNKK